MEIGTISVANDDYGDYSEKDHVLSQNRVKRLNQPRPG